MCVCVCVCGGGGGGGGGGGDMLVELSGGPTGCQGHSATWASPSPYLLHRPGFGAPLFFRQLPHRDTWFLPGSGLGVVVNIVYATCRAHGSCPALGKSL